MRLQCIQSLMPKFLLLINVIIATHCLNATTKTSLHIKRPLSSNYSRRIGERVRLDCEFSVDGPLTPLQLSDISLYWIKNYQEIIQPKRGETTIIRRNLSTMLIMKNLETFDSGSYMCMAELSLTDKLLNASSETTLYVSRAFQQTGPKHESLSDYLLSDMDSLDDDYSLSDEFPSLNPTLIENFDDKGFCEPYRGSICSGIITSNYSVYSTSQQQQDLIEDRLKSIVPLLLKNNLSKRCSTFALPSLCLFAFPLCDRHTNQPKQICRFDCKQLQQDICKNEYLNVKSLFGSKLGDSLQSSLMLDCGQLPPSSDSPAHCLPIVSMTLEKLEVVAMADVNDDKCMVANGLEYRGRQAVTRNGYGCQRWDDQYPHMHQFKNVRQLSGHNYCRNPDNDIEPWCFTTNGRVRKDYCHIDKCGGSAVSGRDTKLANLLYIVVPCICIPFFFFFLFVVFCLCKKGDKSGDESMDEKRMAANRLRMSNMSLGKKNNFQKSCRLTESSKSSVVSSSGDAYRPYDNQHSGQFAQPMPPLPLVQHLPQVNECNMQMKHFHANQFRLVQELGKGKFGPVYIGDLMASFSPTSVVRCVIKTLQMKKSGSKRDEMLKQATSTPNVHQHQSKDAEDHFMEQEFYNEISLYSSLRNRFIANLIGVHTRDDNCDELTDSATMLTDHFSLVPQCMLFEHLNHGDLHEWLLQRSQTGPGQLNPMGSQSNLSAVSSSIGGASTNFMNIQQQQRNVADFLYIGQQIASGMEYLSSQNFVHKDLATRNILMSDNLTVKISIDLIAQYKEAYTKDYYKFQTKTMPVRWMAPEALLYARYSQYSDVWSYGVTLWEIFSYACQPYSGCTNPEAIEMIRDRQLLQMPDECPQRAYALMLECWHEIPTQRPSFAEILNRLRNWENYYLFNNHQGSYHQPSVPSQMPSQVPFQMTASYSTNSHNSKSSSLLGNTVSTGLTASPPAGPPPMLAQYQNGLTTTTLLQQNSYFSPSKNSTNIFASKFGSGGKVSPPSSTLNANALSQHRFYRDDPANSLRASQRNFHSNTNNFVANIPNQNYDL